MMTAEQYWEWLSHQDDDRRFELHDGEVVEFPLMGERHGVVCSRLSFLLGQHLIERRAGLVATNNTALLVSRDPDTLLGPDLMAFDSEKLKGGLSHSFCTRIPDLVVEVFAPEDDWLAVLDRVARYQRLGVPVVWIVTISQPAVMAFGPGEAFEVFEGREELSGVGPLAELRLPVETIFRLPGEDRP